MKKLAEGVFTWWVFSEEKQLDFNGYYLQLGRTSVLIDPPALGGDDIAEIEALGRPSAIVLTNKDHRRKAPEARQLFGAPISIHEADKPLIDCEVDATFTDGATVAEGLRAVHVPDGKSPGETAIYWHERRILIVGDAVIGKPPGAVSLLPAEKLKGGVEKARAGVKRLAELPFDMLLVGDGVQILKGGHAALDALIRAAPSGA